jgi:hypothetical protein
MTTETQTQAAGQQNKGAQLNARRKKKAEGRKKRVLKLQSDRAVAKTYFDSKAKRAADKKSAFRKKKSRKK